LVTVELTNADDEIKPGMTAAVNIIVEQLQDVLLVPNRAVRIFDGDRAVYILIGGKGEWVQVTLGVSSGVESQVVGGDLRLGDEVVLNPPVALDPSFRPGFLRR
jgi:HlyD family secretion protein